MIEFLSIKNEDYLKALDRILSSSETEEKMISLTNAQKTMLQYSQDDIENKHLIEQSMLNEQDLKWLNEQ